MVVVMMDQVYQRVIALVKMLLMVKLVHLDRWTEMRQRAAQRYDALIEESHLGQYLQRPVVKPHRRHV